MVSTRMKMWRSKKFIVAALLIAAVLVGSTAGVALANEGENQPEAQCDALLNRTCEIYYDKTGVEIDAGVLKDAFAQALSERRDEALDSYLQKLVDEGRITPEEAEQYMEWWQARPSTFLSYPPGRFGGHGFCGGIKWGRGHPCWPVPDNIPE
jgi:hypothetical protein